MKLIGVTVSLTKSYTPPLWDAIHTHFVMLIGKWTIVGGWVQHLSDKRDKVGETRLTKILGSR